MSVCAGIALYLLAFVKGADFSLVVPIVNIGVMMSGVVFGALIFGEHLNIDRISGIVLGILSILLLSKS